MIHAKKELRVYLFSVEIKVLIRLKENHSCTRSDDKKVISFQARVFISLFIIQSFKNRITI